MWIQQTAELWVILELTGSGVALGLHSVLRFGPVLLFGAYGGLFSDRVDRCKLLTITQALHAVAATTIAVAALSGTITLPLVYGVVLAQGMVNGVDNPLRRGFIRDLTSDDEITNAVSLNMGVVTVTRTLGPAIGGLLIATLGTEWCFAINAISYSGVLVSLFMLDRTAMRPATLVPRAKGQLRDGFRFAWGNRRVRITLIMVAVVSTFAWNWTTILPVYATQTLGGEASLYGLLVSLLSAGSFVGALSTARIVNVTGAYLIATGTVVAAALLLSAVAPVLPVAIIGLCLLGGSGAAFTVAGQARTHLNADDAMVGRIMALFTVAWVGSRPIGSMIGGLITDGAGPRVAFGFGALMIALTVVIVAVRGPGHRVRSRSFADARQLSLNSPK